MKTWVLSVILLVALVLVCLVGYARRSSALVVVPPNEVPAAAAILPPDPPAASAPVTTPVTVEATKDALAEELHHLMMTFTPAWAEHENEESLDRRRAQIAEQIASAAKDVIPDDPARARRYAVLLTFIGQRETRYARDPKILGGQDNGAAHGYFQVHEWKGENPYLARTAMEMLVEGPENWALPKGKTPWLGEPDAARYLLAHP